MASILKSLRLAADPNRLRLLLLLEREELTVAELQEILGMGQSRISTHLAQLKQAGLVDDRRTGKNAFYRLQAPAELMPAAAQRRRAKCPKPAGDRDALRLVLRKRQDKMRRYFDELAGKFGRQYVPGRSWKGVAEALLKLMPPMVIADLGAGEGTISQLMAQRAKKVIAIDNSEKMVEFGSRTRPQARHRQPGIPAGRPGRRAHPQRHGGSGVSQPGAAPRRAIPSAPSPKPGASSSPAAASPSSISTAITSKKRAKCMPTSGWVSPSSKWSGI